MFLFYCSEVKFDATFKIRNKLLKKLLKFFAFYCSSYLLFASVGILWDFYELAPTDP